jgi:hypothetical protein
MSRLRWIAGVAWRSMPWSGLRREVPGVTFGLLSVAVLVCGVTAGMLAVSLHPRAAMWAGFGLSLVVAVICCVSMLLAAISGRRLLGWAQVLLGLVTLGAIISCAVTAPGTARWVLFGCALFYLAQGLAVLVVQVTTRERVVHLLEVRGFDTERH